MIFDVEVAVEYMSLPASQYSVLDAERIERVDDNTFRCYVYRFKFFAFEVCPVLLVRVEEQTNGCCIKLLSCKVIIIHRWLLLLQILFVVWILWCYVLIFAWFVDCGSLKVRRLSLRRMRSLMVRVSLWVFWQAYHGFILDFFVC